MCNNCIQYITRDRHVIRHASLAMTQFNERNITQEIFKATYKYKSSHLEFKDHVQNIFSLKSEEKSRVLILDYVEAHDDLLIKHNILYAPDFLINAGGLINVYSELKGFSKEQVKEKTEKIFDTTIAILTKSKKENISSQKAALQIAKEIVFKKNTA